MSPGDWGERGNPSLRSTCPCVARIRWLGLSLHLEHDSEPMEVTKTLLLMMAEGERPGPFWLSCFPSEWLWHSLGPMNWIPLKEWDCCGAAVPGPDSSAPAARALERWPLCSEKQVLTVSKAREMRWRLWYSGKVLLFRATGIPVDLKMTEKCCLWRGLGETFQKR